MREELKNDLQAEDNLIKEQICKLLEEDPKLDASKIHIEVNNGEVLLKGKADTEEEKAKAENLAASVNGITKLVNNLHVEVGIIHALSMLAAKIAEVEEGKKKPEE
jgi:osmotically-inducible protein OsmY